MVISKAAGNGAPKAIACGVYDLSRNRGEPGNQVGPGHPLAERVAREPGGPDKGRAVTDNQPGFDENPLQFHIAAGFGREVEVGGDNVIRASLGDLLLDPGDGLLHVDVMKRDAK